VIDPKPPMQPNVEWADVDMLDQDSVTDALKNAHAVFHLAAMADVNDIVADPAESVALNTLGVARVLEAGRRSDAGRVIVSSTVWVYAATHGDVVDESTPFDLETDRHLYVS
jgi:UDP-glucose 4-epimerase